MTVVAHFPPAMPEGRFVKLPGRGTTFVREVEGPPGAPALVLLHGWTATSALNWFPSFEPLGHHFRVVALDHRGHGHGIRSREAFRLEDCADDVAALADQLRIERFIPVGYSMGGPIAALSWRRHHDRVQGLVLCATAARFVGSRHRDWALAQGMFGLSLAAGVSPPSWRRHAMVRLVNNHLEGSRHAEWSTAELHRNDPAALLRAGAELGRFDARPWIGRIDVPTAVVVTEDDRVVPVANQLEMARAIPTARVFRVAGEHAVCALRPERFVPVLLAACQSVAERAALAAGDGSSGVGRSETAG
jgi:pimeloyl-ACP methyl ester carboxylesterase